jgi:hypothetical protein
LEGQVNNFIVTKSSDGITWEESTDDLWSIDVTTAIQAPIATQSDASNRFFDLQGREVKTPTRGLYIRNGRKVVVK